MIFYLSRMLLASYSHTWFCFTTRYVFEIRKYLIKKKLIASWVCIVLGLLDNKNYVMNFLDFHEEVNFTEMCRTRIVES